MESLSKRLLEEIHTLNLDLQAAKQQHKSAIVALGHEVTSKRGDLTPRVSELGTQLHEKMLVLERSLKTVLAQSTQDNTEAFRILMEMVREVQAAGAAAQKTSKAVVREGGGNRVDRRGGGAKGSGAAGGVGGGAGEDAGARRAPIASVVAEEEEGEGGEVGRSGRSSSVRSPGTIGGAPLSAVERANAKLEQTLRSLEQSRQAATPTTCSGSPIDGTETEMNLALAGAHSGFKHAAGSSSSRLALREVVPRDSSRSSGSASSAVPNGPICSAHWTGLAGPTPAGPGAPPAVSAASPSSSALSVCSTRQADRVEEDGASSLPRVTADAPTASSLSDPLPAELGGFKLRPLSQVGTAGAAATSSSFVGENSPPPRRKSSPTTPKFDNHGLYKIFPDTLRPPLSQKSAVRSISSPSIASAAPTASSTGATSGAPKKNPEDDTTNTSRGALPTNDPLSTSISSSMTGADSVNSSMTGAAPNSSAHLARAKSSCESLPAFALRRSAYNEKVFEQGTANSASTTNSTSNTQNTANGCSSAS